MVLKITVKTLDSQNYQFEADDDWNVRQFKDHIQPTVNVSSEEQRLIFCGRVLQNDKKLTEYDCNGKVIHLVRGPPPSLDNPNRESPTTADSNNNNGVLDENVLFSAMTLGPEANQVLRHLLNLRQASYGRAAGTETTSLEASSLSRCERHMHNANRLLRITANSIRECMARLSAPQPFITTASSHDDLHSQDIGDSGSSRSTVDDISVRPQTGRPQSHVRRRPLTTDDLPQFATPNLAPESSQPQTSDVREGNAPSWRRGGWLDRYLDILDSYGDLQDQLQGLIRRYRQLIDMSRRFGSDVSVQSNQPVPGQSTSDRPTPEQSTSNLPAPEQSTSNQPAPEQSTSDQQTSEQSASNPQLSSASMNEANILRVYIPRMMHHMSHLQHALSDFSVDFSRGRLVSFLSSPAPRLLQRRSNRTSDSPSSDASRHPRLEGSVTITATTVEAGPSISSTSSASRPQANATIVVTSEPSGGIQSFPLTFPISFGPNGSLNVDLTGTRNSSAMPSTPSTGTANQASDRQRVFQAEGSAQPQPSTTPNATPGPVRPLGVLTGSIPVPYDYYLPCVSPWANLMNPQSGTRLRVPRQRGTTQTQASGTEAQATNASQANASGSSSQTLDMGLTEVVSNIVGTILRGPQVHGTSALPNQNQDPLLNIIPELALNAASQILGGVLGFQSNNQQAAGLNQNQNQQQQSQQQSTQQQQNSRVRPPVSGTVMMDIDIDDDSSSQSESRYQDARDTRSPSAAASAAYARTASLPSTSSSSSSTHIPGTTRAEQPRASTSSSNGVKYDRRQLVEAMHNHPDWIPIIESDIDTMNRQRARNNSQPVFSDAYLSSIPRKRRRLLTASPDRVLILQPSPSQAITNLLRRAITNSNSPDIEALDQVLGIISSDADLQSAYEDYIKAAVEARLRSDYDYCPQKFENSSKYFK